MAQLEDLIQDIADPRLRAQIASEVGQLKTRKKFGLVFEQHLPETVQLPSLPVKRGTRVAYRDGRTGLFTVSGINGKTATILPELPGGRKRRHPRAISWSSSALASRFTQPLFSSTA